MQKSKIQISQKDVAWLFTARPDAEQQEVARKIQKKYKLPFDRKYSISANGDVFIGGTIKLTNV